MKKLDIRSEASALERGRGWVVLGIVLVSLVAVRWSALEKTSSLRRTDVTSSEVRRELTNRKDPLTKRRDEAAQRRFDMAASELSLPWEDVFAALEQAYLPEVTVLSIEPNRETRTLKITGAVPRLEDAVTFVARLSNRPVLTESVLIGFEPKSSAISSEPGVAFVASTKWRQP